MRKVIVSMYLTLDGVMEEPGHWSFPFWSKEAAKFKFDELFASDALLLGRLTYEGFARAWPSMTDEQGFAERMNNLPKYVVSTTLEKAEWNNSNIIRGNIAHEVASLKQQPGLDILVSGSGQLVHTLMQHNLVDEYRFMVHPLILGNGKRLFQDDSEQTTLKLTETKTFSTGIVILTYQPA